MIVTLGEALVALVPTEPVRFNEAENLRLMVGGAELNFAVGVQRLGCQAAWVGRVGDDSLGRLVLDTLEHEGVDARWVQRDATRPTGLYLREWLPDGERRPYYYRRGSAATVLSADTWPAEELGDATWLHVTGITAALGPRPLHALHAAVAWATQHGIPVSFDPNYRPALWKAPAARDQLAVIASQCQVLLMSEEDCELLFGTADSDAAIERAHAMGIETVVLKLGKVGAIGSRGGERIFRPADIAEHPIDPVGAGDGFNAGFVAAHIATGDLRQALALAAHVGARAVERVAEHAYPRDDELPDGLRVLADDRE